MMGGLLYRGPRDELPDCADRLEDAFDRAAARLSGGSFGAAVLATGNLHTADVGGRGAYTALWGWGQAP